MRKIILFLFCFNFLVSFAQQDAWVYFTDKPNSQFYFDNPLEMLSQRALDRRTNQNIALDSKDVPISISYIEQIQNQEGITILAKSKWLNAIHVRGNQENIAALTTFEFVDIVFFANRSLNTSGKKSTNQEIKKFNKHLETFSDFQYGNSANQIEMLNGHLLHQDNFTGNGKIIAVLDNGFVGVNTIQPFQRLFDNNKILGGYDFVNRDDDVYDGGTHGTLVLSTIGGFKENELVGTAPDAFYYLFKTEATAYENPLEESLWVEAAEMADSLGVDVINTSLGYFQYDNPAYNYTYEDMNGTTSFISRGLDIAYSRGMICVTSAGNSGNTSNPNIAVPADATFSLTVGAVNTTGEYASFSSIGPSFDGRIKPDIASKGFQASISNTLGEIGVASGTSFSSPIIAGLVACLWEALPSFTNTQIMDLIKQSAHLYANPNFQLGYGIPNFYLAYQNGLLLNTSTFNQAIVTVYPNPAKDILNVNFENESFSTIIIYNQLGQIVLNQKISQNQNTINIENISSGMFFYKLISENQVNIKSGKFIKQ